MLVFNDLDDLLHHLVYHILQQNDIYITGNEAKCCHLLYILLHMMLENET